MFRGSGVARHRLCWIKERALASGEPQPHATDVLLAIRMSAAPPSELISIAVVPGVPPKAGQSVTRLSLAGSALLHGAIAAGVVCAASLGYLNAWEDAEFELQQGLVQVVASLPSEANDEPTAEVQVAEMDVEPPPDQAPDLTPRKTTPARCTPPDSVAQSADVLEVQDHGETPTALPLVASRADVSVELPVATAESTPVAVPRRATSVPPSAATAANTEVAGVESARPVSFFNNPPPRYPPRALANGWHGKVLLRIDIDAHGRIVNVAVETSSGYDVLDAAALEAVRHWRAAPAIRGGRAVASTERQPIIFRPRR